MSFVPRQIDANKNERRTVVYRRLQSGNRLLSLWVERYLFAAELIVEFKMLSSPKIQKVVNNGESDL
ncbi:STYKc [Musa troglodytarum]|uniref:STYKc n=1 Tax=Musa troglodytarum TaxID=320322 RepID=A0A9E7FU07_9LILI|nr:STYKc [Musa troglodytarum]